MTVHLSGKDKLKVVLIGGIIVLFMAIVSILAACNFFEHFSMDYCAAACMKLFPNACAY